MPTAEPAVGTGWSFFPQENIQLGVRAMRSPPCLLQIQEIPGEGRFLDNYDLYDKVYSVDIEYAKPNPPKTPINTTTGRRRTN
jgi:hypothetical protein